MSNDKQAEQTPLSSSVSKDTSTQPHLSPTQPERLEVIIEAANNAESQESEPATFQPVIEEEADDETRPLLAGNNQENSDDGGLGITRYTTDRSEHKGPPPASSFWSTASSELLEPLLQDQQIWSLDEEDLEEGMNQLRAAENKGLPHAASLTGEVLSLGTEPNLTRVGYLIQECSTILSILEPIERRLRTFQVRHKLLIGCFWTTAASPILIFGILRARFGETIFGSIPDFLAQVIVFCIISGAISSWLHSCTKHYAFRLSTAEKQALERFNLFDLQDEQNLEWYVLTSTNLFRYLVEARSALQMRIPVLGVTNIVLGYTLPDEPDEFFTEIQRILRLPSEAPEPQPSTEEVIIETKDIAAPSSAANDIPINFHPSEAIEISIQMTNSSQTISSSSTSSFFTRRAANQPAQPISSPSNTQQTTPGGSDSTEEASPSHTKLE